MQARDAAGRQVSLLNDDTPSYSYYSAPRRLSYRTANHVVSQPYHPAARSTSSSPDTPELLRSDSYDSNISTGPGSPLTPTSYEYARLAFTSSGQQLLSDDYDPPAKRPAYAATSRSNSFDDDSQTAGIAPEKPGKRYPCRYRESHGCDKTFTTSGHASRHSKIHTAEKAVQCTFQGCQKKFTRADNMKQHLETHFKDKSRSTGASKTSSRTHSGSGLSTNSKRTPSAATRTTASARATAARNRPTWEPEQYGFPPTGATPLASPDVSGAWDLRPLNGPLTSRPCAARTPSSGLDALAMAVACQEGA